jgi:hypothetical protein
MSADEAARAIPSVHIHGDTIQSRFLEPGAEAYVFTFG